MKIAIFINTPAQVHFFKNIYTGLKERGHTVYILYRDYGETKDLIKEFDMPAYLYGSPPRSKIGKLVHLPVSVMVAARYLRDKNIDIVLGFGVYDAYTSFLLNVPCVVFTDSEPNANRLSYTIQFKLYIPFVDHVITPDSYRQDLGKKHIRVNSYKELAYLHPNYFKPNDDIFRLLGIEKGEMYAIFRFNAFDAVHDAGVSGFTDQEKIRLVMELEKSMKVFISSESKLPDSISDRIMKIPKNRIHDALFYSQLLIADTGTMVTEAALLGVPSIILHPKVNNFGNFIELNSKYNLIFTYEMFSEELVEKAIELINDFNIKTKWNDRKNKLFSEKLNIVDIIISYIENYDYR